MCRACLYFTRETGHGESEVALCRECFDGKPGDEVLVANDQMAEDEFFRKHGTHSRSFESAPVGPQTRVIECGDCGQVLATNIAARGASRQTLKLTTTRTEP